MAISMNMQKQAVIMIQTAVTGTARSVFSDYPISVACKTGTAQTSGAEWEDGGTEENISFICYAPANDPEIAVAVVLEHGRSGNYAMNVAKDMLDYYFGFYTWDDEWNKFDQDGNQVDDDGKIIKTALELDEAKATPTPGPSGSPDGEGAEDSGDAEPTPTPIPKRGSDIPDRIFTGGSVAADVPEAGSTPGPTPAPQLDTPDYTGSGSEGNGDSSGSGGDSSG